MRILKLAVAVLLPLTLWGGLLHASGFENTGLGTTARGMGGAFRAVADDWTAAYYNPAGYAYIVDNQLGASLGLLHFRNTITPDFVAVDEFGNEYGWGIANGQEVYNFHRILNNPSGGFIVRLPFWGETVFGLSAFQPFDQSLRWRMYALDASMLRTYNEDAVGHPWVPGHHYLIDLDVVAFQLTAAREFMEGDLAVGVGLQLLRGDLWFSDLAFRANPRAEENPSIAVRPWDRVPEFVDSQGRGWGFGLRGGLLWKASEKLNVAATAYLPFDLTIKGETFYTFIMPKEEFAIVVPNSADYLFVTGEILRQTSDFETKLKLPAQFALGVSFQATEKLMVALDGEYTLWSKYEGLSFAFSNFGSTPQFEQEFFQTDLANPVDWDNAGKVALGLRYELNPTLTLLAGGSFDQSPTRNSTELTPQFMDLGTKKSINGGGILHINQWDVGLITSYYSYPDISLQGLTDVDDNGTFDNFPGDYKASTYETVLSLGYRF